MRLPQNEYKSQSAIRRHGQKIRFNTLDIKVQAQTLRKVEDDGMTQIKTGIMAGALCALAVPALAGPPYNVDDPGTAEYRHIEENTAYTTSRTPDARSDQSSTEINYGYSKNIQLTLGSGMSSQRLTGARPVSGMGDTGAEVKWRFREEDAKNPGLSLHYFLKIPTAGAADGLGSGKFDHALLMAAGKQVGRLYAFGDVGGSLPGAPDERNNLVLGGAVSYQLTAAMTVGGQVYGNTSAAVGEKGNLSWGLTATRDVLPGKTLMLQVGRSTQGPSNLNVYAGLQFMLDTRRH